MKNKMKQVQFNQLGTPDALQLVETDIPQPKMSEVLIKVEAIGVNYSDTFWQCKNRFNLVSALLGETCEDV